MAVVVDPGLLGYMASSSGSCTFVRDAGTARNGEIQLTADPAKVAESHAAMSTWKFPPAVEIRLDRRR
jgi:hypothetical protein